MTQTETELVERYLEATSYVQEPALEDEAPELIERFHDIEGRLETLWSRDHAEWIAGFYRNAYRAWTAGDRDDPPCNCPNPRCPLKQGSVPFQLRRRKTSLDTPDRTPMETLRAYLKTHPEATVIEEALAEIEGLRADVMEALADYNRDARDVLDDHEAIDNQDIVAAAVKDRPTLDIPDPEGA
jgi:hypothetical protein